MTMTTSGECWTAATTHPHQQGRAIVNLRKQNFDSFYPMVFEARRGGSPAPVPLFGSYVFLRVDEDDPRWGAAANTIGVSRLLTWTERKTGTIRPQRVPEAFIASMRRVLISRCRRCQGLGSIDGVDCPSCSGSGKSSIDYLDPGTEVRIKHGPFTSHIAVVDWSQNDRVGVLAQLFKREISLEFYCRDVEVVADRV